VTRESISRRDVLRGAAAAGVAGIAGIVRPGTTGAVRISGVAGAVATPAGLNMHSGPNDGHPVSKWLPDATPLTIRRTSGDWFRVYAHLPGQDWSGWVNSWYVTLTGTPSTAISIGNGSTKQVALTFDCGSDIGYTNQILSTLAHHGVAASFGITGAWMKANPDNAKTIADRGFQMINHTLSHPSFTGLSTATDPISPAARLAQIQGNEAMIREITGKRTKPYWRPPYGDIDDGVLRDVGALGFTKTAMWTIDSFGWNGLRYTEIIDRVMGQMVPGAIVLMHVGAASQDGNAIDPIIRQLKADGYTFGTFAEVIK
jgi:peptidoglycan/xylan/chitin deacetylase (PgdA/CDA1 family)